MYKSQECRNSDIGDNSFGIPSWSVAIGEKNWLRKMGDSRDSTQKETNLWQLQQEIDNKPWYIMIHHWILSHDKSWIIIGIFRSLHIILMVFTPRTNHLLTCRASGTDSASSVASPRSSGPTPPSPAPFAPGLAGASHRPGGVAGDLRISLDWLKGKSTGNHGFYHIGLSCRFSHNPILW